ncbi:MAG: Uma2 family endonuclease [Frankiaceae bacterium]|nr:Uma2 family endonuclease [Frankiaceae bacterium]
MTLVTAQPLAWDGYTVADLEALPDDALRYELVDGALLVTPPAINRHDFAATELSHLLHDAIPPEWRVLVPGAVEFDRHNFRIPDLLVLQRLRPKYADPDDVVLAVEVMSPSSVTTDRLVKPAQYAAAGIAHFWRLELVDRLLVTYALEGDSYRETGRFTDAVVIDEPARLRFRLGQLLD